MYSPSLLIFGVVILSICPVNCQGTASILNWCDFEVYVWSVANVTNNTINYLAPTIGDYGETYRTNPNGGGISLKIATVPVDSNITITQFEYTYHTYNPNVYYDISNINGYPFEIWGLALSPSTPSGPNCTSLSCDPGVAFCPDVYNAPNDDYAVRFCDVSTNLTLTLCPFQTTMATATEPVTATITTTDAGGNTVLSTLTTVLSPVEPTTIPESQTMMVTATETVTATITTTDAGGNTVLSTLTTVLTTAEPTTIPPSQITMVTTTETVTATIMPTDSGGNAFLSTLTTVLTPVEPATIPPSQITMVTATETVTAIIVTTDAGGNTGLSTLTTVLTPAEPTTIPPSQTTMETATETTFTTVMTDLGGNIFLSTLTTVLTPVTTTETITATIVTTNAESTEGNIILSTLTTVLTTVEQTMIL